MMNESELKNLFNIEYDINDINGNPIIQISNDSQNFLESYHLKPDEIKKYAQEHNIYGLYFIEDEIYINGKRALSVCDADPPATNYSDSCTYKITLKTNIDLHEKRKEIGQIKDEVGIEIDENEFYYWLFFHELGHTYKASENYHVGAKVTEQTKTQNFKDKQEKIAKEYGFTLYKKWKAKI